MGQAGELSDNELDALDRMYAKPAYLSTVCGEDGRDDMAYFIICSDEDGMDIYQYSREELEELLNDEDHEKTHFFDHVPTSDKGCWTEGPENSILIIKGEIIVPKAVTKVTKFEVE